MSEIKQNTHLLASERLVGSVITISEKSAEVKLKITEEMSVDDFSLAHGGFVFGLADYAAMVAINEPTVVLGKAEVKFLKPVKIQEELIAKANITDKGKGKKIVVDVRVVNSKQVVVFEGEFVCFVLENHVLQK